MIARVVLALLCAFVVLCVLVALPMVWWEASHYVQYYKSEIVIAVVLGALAGPTLYDWATQRKP